MLILLDCRPLQGPGPASEKTRFLLSCAAGLTEQEGVQWLFLLNKGGRSLPLPAGEKVMTWKYFWAIPRIVRKYQADLIMMTDGRLAGGTKVPQCCWIPGKAEGKVMEKVRAARAVLCFADKTDKEIFSGVHAVPPAPDEGVAPLSMEAREAVKGRVSEGKEYFYTDIAGAPLSGVINLLKAFSLFKKRQLSNMKLVLAGEGDPGLAGKLDSYKYRQDVCLVPAVERDILGAAYGAISLERRGSLSIDVLNAWKVRVPVITSAAREAVLRVPAGDPAALADGLKSLYKDETFRNGLIEKAAPGVADLSLRRSVATIWDAIGRNQ
ncbi:glycosyltransferase [Flavitalea sp. BT771]|uniref:glycosyltransferase n=1 Tax=Flavitalea sp. BT771 TaxID=3063329 RepID=UPI0026E387B9|nr:glycosyltransferase [Flavitalea sp. BT771]MDO6434309.1 glycosyltransferase [Flavitalea sp. BT771]MDV6223209.1 glycosyltransferase [Flavitalea sp. BT771]